MSLTMTADGELTLVAPESVSRNGRTVRVGPRGFVLLAHLTRRRSMLMSAVKVRVWYDANEPDHSVTQLVYRLNKKLTELGEPRRLVTVGGRVNFG